MAELLEEQRESWGTRGSFVMAAVGSAVGLGNLWGFPYKLYSYGGGAFLVPYIVAMFVVGIPLMILEFSLGHYTQRAAPDAFKRGHKGDYSGIMAGEMGRGARNDGCECVYCGSSVSINAHSKD